MKKFANLFVLLLILISGTAAANMEITLTSKQYLQLKAYPEGNGKGMQAYVKSCANGKCDATIKEFAPKISAEVNLFVNPDPNSFSYCDFYWTYDANQQIVFEQSKSFCKDPYTYKIQPPSCDSTTKDGCKISISKNSSQK